MSVILQLPPGTQFYQPVVEFTGIFNAPTVGQYDFATALNTAVPILNAKREHVYLIERYSASATIPEGDFLSAINVIPTLEIRKPRETNAMIHPQPVPFVNYIDGLEVLMYAHVVQDQDLKGTFKGSLLQPAALVGIPQVTVQFQFNIYEIKNGVWIENFLGLTKGGQARGLVLPKGRG